MIIEVCVTDDSNTKEKGDLLEQIAKLMLERQNYYVEREVRKTGTELDLYCIHKINKRVLYVECKAFRDKKVDAPIIRQLMGTVVLDKNIDEGWLISTSELSKDALGIYVDISDDPKRTNTSIYTPQKVIESLIASNIVVAPPEALLRACVPKQIFGDWYLLINPFGYFWAKIIIKSGTPHSIICFDAKNGQIIEDNKLLNKISLTDTSLNKLEFTPLST